MGATDLFPDRLEATTAPDAATTRGRPAGLARIVDLQGLRHDYPLVLTDDGDVTTLTAVVNDLLTAVATPGARGERLRQHVLRLETAIRRWVAAHPGPTTLAEAWDSAATELLPEHGGEDLRTSLATARDALHLDGRLVGCDDAAPATVLRHLRDGVEVPRAAALRDQFTELVRRLSAVLAVDERRSAAGRDPDRLRAAVGAPHEADFDFAAWADVLAARPHDGPLTDARRTRIEWAIGVLRDQRFVALDPGRGQLEAFTFEFDSCALALQAHHERLPELARVVKAVATAELELDNAYDEATHGVWFHTFDAAALRAEDLQPFPRSLVLLDEEGLDATTRAQVLDLLASPLPCKVAVVTRDAVGAPPLHDLHGPRPLAGPGFVAAALGLGTAPVVQATTAGLARMTDALQTALAEDGPALLSVVTGSAHASADLPPYLAAAAAAETRLVPEFAHDPVGGCTLAPTGQPAADWPTHRFQFEDEHLQRVQEDLAVTPADLVAVDPRFAAHGTCWPRHAWTDAMVPVAEFLAKSPRERHDLVPYVPVVDQDDVLQRVVVDDHVVALAERTLRDWRRLQERAGVRLTEEQQRLEDDRRLLEEERAALAAAATTGDATAAAAPAPSEPDAPSPADEAPAVAPEPAAAISSGEAWIETARCTTCDECTNLNSRMFAYNDEKQAYIADVHAGTFGELVQAAEACQVAIIHPGEPWDPDEAGLDDLRRRAAAFS